MYSIRHALSPLCSGWAGRTGAKLFVIMIALTLAGCPVPPRQGGDGPIGRPATGCPAGVVPIGVLSVVSDVVLRNGRRAFNGERVCEGDRITTAQNGVGVVLPDGDRESDSVHIAENTDPRFTWTRAGCLHVDDYGNGRVIATARRRCMIVRTPDTLMLVNNGRMQFEVLRAAAVTQVVPVRGSYAKLPNLSAREVHDLSQPQLQQRALREDQQPQMHAVSEYRAYNLTKPPTRLPTLEIKRIDESVFNRSLILQPIRPGAPILR